MSLIFSRSFIFPSQSGLNRCAESPTGPCDGRTVMEKDFNGGSGRELLFDPKRCSP